MHPEDKTPLGAVKKQVLETAAATEELVRFDTASAMFNAIAALVVERPKSHGEALALATRYVECITWHDQKHFALAALSYQFERLRGKPYLLCLWANAFELVIDSTTHSAGNIERGIDDAAIERAAEYKYIKKLAREYHEVMTPDMMPNGRPWRE